MLNLRNFKHIFLIIAICLSGIFGMFLFQLTDFFVPVNNFLIYRTGGTPENSPWQDKIYKHKNFASEDKIVMIHIDEKTINEIQWRQETQSLGITKDYYAKLTKFLLRHGVKAVGYDIVFQNADPKYEKIFAEILEKNQNIVIATTSNTHNQCVTDKNSDIETCLGMPRSIYKNANWGLIDMGNSGKIMNSKNLSASREMRLMSDDQQKYFLQKIPGKTRMYTLPFAMIDASGDTEAIEKMEKYITRLENENKKSALKNCEKKSDPESCKKSVEIEIPSTFGMQPYFTKEELFDARDLPYQTISLLSLIKNPQAFDREIFEGKYIIIGESGDTLHDRFISPTSGQYIPGMYAHAFLLDAILHDKMLEKISEKNLFIAIIALTMIFVGIYFFTPKFISPIIFVASVAGTIYFARYYYDAHRVVIEIFPILMATALITYPITYVYKFFILERDKRLILNNFSRYLSPSVVKMIDTQKIDTTLGGEKKELSILFSDIAGFTTISEKLDTKDLFRLMTKYLSRMTNILTENHGTLDKYIGDAVMGFFGAPVDDEMHAINACKTAIAMKKALAEINENLTKDGLDTISFRIGIATGEVLVGNIGSENRFNYTVLGDNVNLASRLEGLGKEYGVQTIIADSTRRAIGNNFIVRELDCIAVKGKNIGTRIFELIDETNSEINLATYQTYESALCLYREGQYLTAGRIFEKLMEIDPPSRVMALRCAAILKGEMQIENGIYKMTHK